MIICPNCHHKEFPGALFCSECGARLISLDYLTTQSIKKSQSDKLRSDSFEIPASFNINKEVNQQESIHTTELSLVVVDGKHTLNLAGRSEFTLGRVAEGQPILPDVDLSPFEAYSLGVSRLHAALKVNHNRVSIMDLGSSNGTRVNGQKIVPHVDYPINQGDIIALGKLKLQIILR